jgi:hypothetical protein
MASRTIPARIVSLVCLLAILLVALPCATIPAHAAMAHCDPCCPTHVSATPTCCTAAPQPAAFVPPPFAPAFTLDQQRLQLTREAIPAAHLVVLTTRNTSSPPLHAILRI